ncbi:hypothetical protein HYS54_04775 [Candidatus Micrarchaeota archaeon]|nr:hypothetical protein [Candidatus Micrarchaeota archaeon]
MRIGFSKGSIRFEKPLSDLDRFVYEFVDILKSAGVRYVIVSGYVSIMFGRPRTTEDIDILAERFDFGRFMTLLKKSRQSGFRIINPGSDKELFYDYLAPGEAIRFCKQDVFPNVEIKFAKTSLHLESLKNAIDANGLRISPIELQIAYKLKLGSRKDIEDADFLYELFKEKLDKEQLGKYCAALEVSGKAKKYLGLA